MDATLQVDISDALSERDKVKFTVHTKVRLCTSPGPSEFCHKVLLTYGPVSTEHAPQLQTERVLCGATARRVHLAARLVRGKRRLCRIHREY